MSNQLHRPLFFRHALTILTAIFLAALPSNVNGQITMSPATTTSGMTGPSNGGQGLSYIISPSYAGMGFEPSNLFAFTGTTSPNPLTVNLMSTLANYTGQPPHIRVGGNTGDTAIYNASYTGYGFQDNPYTTGPTDVAYYGPNYFKVINYFPKNTPVTFGLPMAYDGANATEMRQAITEEVLSTLTNVKLWSLEVANEPDLYPTNKYRPSSWTSSNYGQEWSSNILSLYQSTLQPKGISQSVFEAACSATASSFKDYQISTLVTTDLATATDNGLYISGWNQHNYLYYVNVSSFELTTQWIMNLQNTVHQFTSWTWQTQQAITTGKPFYLREMGSCGPNGWQGISNTFTNAIWTLNFFLFTSTVGVQSVQIHHLQDSYGSAWQPIVDPEGNQPFVRPSYAAWAAFAQIIGAGCQTQIAPITLNSVPSGYSNTLAAYGAYNNGNLQTIIVVNSNIAYASQGSSINTQQVTVTLPTSMAGQTFYISLMTAPGTDSTNNTTWNGISYEYNNGTPQVVDNSVQSSQVQSDGTFTFTVRDTQVAVANLGSQIGTQNAKPNTQACQKFYTSPIVAKSTGSGFKATSGFAGDGGPLSLGAIIGIAAGGGSALLILLGLIIFCCVRRARRRRTINKSSDTSSLLPPGMGGKNAPYKTVPFNDMADSADDIYMLPVGKGGKGAPYNSMKSVSTAGSPFRGHKHSDSYGSATPSMTNSPLLPGSPNFGSRARVDSYSSENAIPPPARSGSPKPGSRYAGQPGYGGQSNLNPNSRSGHSSHGHSAENAAMGAGAAATGYYIAKKMNEQGNVRRSANAQQMQQQQPQYLQPPPQQSQMQAPSQHQNPYGSVEAWQQLAQQQQQQQFLSPGHPQAYAQQYGQERGRFISTPNAAAAEGSLGLAGEGMAAGQRRADGQGELQYWQGGQQNRVPERRKSLPPSNRGISPSNGEKRRSKQSGAVSSQGHGYRNSMEQQGRSRPPVPDLPESIRASLPSEPRSPPRDKAKTSNSAAIAAATAAIGGTTAAQNAYAAQRQQYQSHHTSLPPTQPVIPHEMRESESNYGMAMSSSVPMALGSGPGAHERSGSYPALLDPHAYAMAAAQPRSSSEMAFYRQNDPAGASAQAYGNPMRQSGSHPGQQNVSPPRPSRSERPPMPRPPMPQPPRGDGPPGYAQ